MSNQQEEQIMNQMAEAILLINKGCMVSKIDTSSSKSEGLKKLAEAVNYLIAELPRLKDSIVPIADGNLNIEITSKNFLAAPFKDLQAKLRHLTWQTQQVAKGDLSQHVDFMGDFSNAFNSMILSLSKAREELSASNRQLQEHKDNLEKLVNQRTEELERKLREVETFNKIAVGREIMMVDLKKEVDGLLRELGRPRKYSK